MSILVIDKYDIREATEEEKDFLVANCRVNYYGGHGWLRETSLNTETVCIEVVTEGIFKGKLRKPKDIIHEVSVHGMCEYACSSMLNLPSGLRIGEHLKIERKEGEDEE